MPQHAGGGGVGLDGSVVRLRRPAAPATQLAHPARGRVILLFAGLAGRGVPALAGAAALAGVYLLVHLALPAAMGAGDVKLAIGLGGLTGCFGVEVWFLAALAAPLLTAVCGVMVTPWGVRTLPHGPSMCVASLGAVGLALLG